MDVERRIDEIRVAQQMGGEDRWASGYCAGVDKMAFLMRELVRAVRKVALDECEKIAGQYEYSELPAKGRAIRECARAIEREIVIGE